jgi:WD40 repeat protein
MIVGTSRIGLLASDSPASFDSCYVVGKASRHPNLLQVWTVEDKTQVKYFIGLEASGSIWSVSWSPDAPSESYLGRVAVVCGDGTCRVIALPSGIDESGRTSDDYVVFEEKLLCRYRLQMPSLFEGTSSSSSPSQAVLITCADWLNSGKVVCGTSSGHIVVYSLLSAAEGGNVYPESISYDLSDYSPKLPSTVCLRSVTVCPYATDMIVTCGYDGFLKFWDAMELPVTTPSYKFYSRGGPQVGWLYDVRRKYTSILL